MGTVPSDCIWPVPVAQMIESTLARDAPGLVFSVNSA